MKIAILSTYDVVGGAFKAAYRLHKGLIEKGLVSSMFVLFKTVDDRSVFNPIKGLYRKIPTLLPFINNLPLLKYRKRKKDFFSPSWISSPIINEIKHIDYQIAHLQWINKGFVSIRVLKKIKKPIIWTIHDMWIFTGGCHYAGDCKKYITGCNRCPTLGSKQKNDLSKRIFQQKIKHWKNLDLIIVSPSKWLADCARKSFILKDRRIEVIPYNIDTSIYKPIDKQIARKIMNLPQDKLILLFGATNALDDKRKGISYLLEALNWISIDRRTNLSLVVFGSSKPEKPLISEFDIVYMGEFKDDQSLALIYSSADVFIAPSLEDNLPLTVMESLSCGTPVVAFNVGGIPDMIEHKVNGYLASPLNSIDLYEGILWVVEDSERRISLGKAARDKILSAYTDDIVIEKYKHLYSELLKQKTQLTYSILGLN
jgi:glycosyltransferase involved in cell wall biosynthesis